MAQDTKTQEQVIPTRPMPTPVQRRPLTLEQAKDIVADSREALAILAKDDGRMHSDKNSTTK